MGVHGSFSGFILEHPTRGTLQEINWDPYRDPPRWVPKFAWSGPRSDSKWYPTLIAAREDRDKLAAGQLRDRTKVLKFGTWEEVK